jgi:hypothetical protein
MARVQRHTGPQTTVLLFPSVGKGRERGETTPLTLTSFIHRQMTVWLKGTDNHAGRLNHCCSLSRSCVVKNCSKVRDELS